MVIKTVGPHHSWNKCKNWDVYFKDIQPMLEEYEAAGKVILPPAENRFRCFELGLDDIKVVILGQDPYPTKGHAHGLAFSTLPHIDPIPPSLRNIFTEMQEDVGGSRPRSGDLRVWSTKGIFLFNTALTVEEGKPVSHLNLWRKFTYATLSRVSRCKQPIAWLLWGKQAQQYEALVPAHHLKLCAGHPSSLSVKLFRGCKHFSKAAEFLNEDPLKFWSLESG